MKNTLVVHVKDPTTDFLCPIYNHLSNITLVRSPLERSLMNKLIDAHDQVLMMGHGCPTGLFGPLGFIIGHGNVEALARKDNNVFIWCHANKFVEMHNLRGFSTSMFISEDAEAAFHLPDEMYTRGRDEHAVHEQNYLFARLMGESIHLPTFLLHAKVKSNFIAENTVADNKSVVNYNNNGLLLF